MERYIRYPSQQSAFDANKTLVDLHLPDDGLVYDLSKSYVAITVANNLRIQNKPNDVLNVGYLVNTEAADNQTLNFRPEALVRNAQMSSQNMGKLEDVRKVNLLKNTLNLYKHQLEEEDDSSTQFNQHNHADTFITQLRNEFNQLGTEQPREKDSEIRIPLKHIFNVANARAYDTSKYGSTRIHLECLFGLLNSFQADNELADANARIQNRTANANNDTKEPIGHFADVANATGGNITVESINSVGTYEDLRYCPFYVGMPLVITSDNNNAGAVVNSGLKINSVTHNTDQTVTLGLDGSIATVANGTTLVLDTVLLNTNITADNIPTYRNIELVAHVNEIDKPPPQLTYTEYQAEDDTYQAATLVSRNYHIPAATKNLYIMFQNNGTAGVSKNTHLSKYRITIDNVDVTGRDVHVGSGLHLDLINKVFTNNGESVRNLRERQQHLLGGKSLGDGVLAANQPAIGVEARMIAVPVPFVNRLQTLNLRLEAQGGNLNGFHTIYYEVQKQK